jgi:hypothetical protein
LTPWSQTLEGLTCKFVSRAMCAGLCAVVISHTWKIACWNIKLPHWWLLKSKETNRKTGYRYVTLKQEMELSCAPWKNHFFASTKQRHVLHVWYGMVRFLRKWNFASGILPQMYLGVKLNFRNISYLSNLTRSSDFG